MGCNKEMKHADALELNRMAANMIGEMQIRCVNRSISNGDGDGDGDGNGNGNSNGDGDGSQLQRR
jgi:hypothetical protein